MFRLVDVNFLYRDLCVAGGNGYSSKGLNFLLMKFNRSSSVGGGSGGWKLCRNCAGNGEVKEKWL
jgi:hypothetical protein